VILGVGYDDEVNEGAGNGLHETLAAGSIVAVSSTVAPDTVRGLEKRYKAKGVKDSMRRYAAGAGLPTKAAAALVRRADAVVERARPVWNVLFGHRPSWQDGHGRVGKAMNNLLLWITTWLIGRRIAGPQASTW
jgi:3-hydroxyisobutyrate dehydrogenase-like beta-hydroxyacid dehydrogenase